MAEVSSEDKESLSGIGWKDEWLDESKVHTTVRISDPSLLTIQIVYTLCKLFPSKTSVLKFLKFLLPIGSSLPDCKKFNRLVTKVVKQRALSLKNPSKDVEFGEDLISFSVYWVKPFFTKADLTPVSGLPPSQNELDKLQIETMEKRLKKQKLDFEERLKEEHSKCILLTEKVDSLTKTVNELNSDCSSKTKAIAGLKGKLLQEAEKRARLGTQNNSQSVVGNNGNIAAAEVDKGLGFITITKVLDQDSRMFEGTKYFFNSQSGKLKSNHQPAIYANVTSKINNSAVTEKQLSSRATFFFLLLSSLSGGFSFVTSKVSFDVKEMSRLLVKFLKLNPSFFRSCVGVLPRDFFPKLSPEQAADVKSVLRFSMSGFRNLRIVLLSCLGYNIFPSEGKLRAVQSNRLSHLKDAGFYVTAETLMKLGTEKARGKVNVLRCRDLIAFLQSVLLEYKQKGLIGPDDAQRRIDLLFSGDKGGSMMKFHFEVICGQSKLSVYDVHIFSMYSAADSYENMSVILFPFRDQLIEIQREEFRLDGHPVKVLLGGDFHFQDDCLGHQGSSSTFPSAKWDVTLAHLREHGGKPHSPLHCKEISLREIDDLDAFYAGNLLDDRAKGDLRKLGRFHASVCNHRIFPILTLRNVVPPVLHIMLGIVLRLFNLLTGACREIDCLELKKPSHAQILKTHEENLAKLKEAKNTLDEKRRSVASDLVDLYNSKERLEEAIAGNKDELDKISKCSDNSRKRADKKFRSCTGLKCIASVFDSNLNWVLCGQCGKWIHCICDLIPTSEQRVYADQADVHYICLKCHNFTLDDLPGFIRKTVEGLNNDLSIEEAAYQKACHAYAHLEETVAKVKGPTEKKLDGLLKDINVDRQAYFDNAFVGNHCKHVLDNHVLLCSILNHHSMRPRLVRFFEIFANIKPLLFTKRELTQSEIDFVTI
ncbi:uncharacterized protein, partial [Clytia hemisphaerica]|uniref:uncharacterized protein n=1 Tax=Clytia hemisphaerica TaxID=252671 RepID=UPI0034D3C9FF